MRDYIDLAQSLFERFDPEQFLTRMAGVMQLVRRGATEGERDAAREAFTRMMQRAKDEVARMRQEGTVVEVDRFLRGLERIQAGSGARQEPPKQKPRPEQPKVPRYRVGQWVVWRADANYVGKITHVLVSKDGIFYTHSRGGSIPESIILRPATQDEIDAAMASRAKTTKSRTDKGTDWRADLAILELVHFVDPAINSNKVYGIVKRNGKIYTFWGGFGKSLKVKLYPDEQAAYAQVRAKVRKGYREVNRERYEDWLKVALKREFARTGE